jgi:carbon-monoxide dehydrogenase large subunit
MTDMGIGRAVKRTEDLRFITGKGHYLDDFSRPHQVYAAFVRSPHAHAEIKKINKAKALKVPGVVAVLTGEELAADKIGTLICGWVIKGKDGSPHKAPPHPALAVGKVRYVGDHVAVVLGDTLAAAKDGAEAVEVDYKALPAVVDTASAHKSGQPQIHTEAPNNLCYDWELGDKAKRPSPAPRTR